MNSEKSGYMTIIQKITDMNDKFKRTVASELIIVAMETKGKRPTQLNFEEMIDVVAM